MHLSTTSLSPTTRWVIATVVIAILAFALRWDYANTAIVPSKLRGDAHQYYAYAWNLAHQGVFSHADPEDVLILPDSYRDPGYPAFLAALMMVFGDGDAWYAAVLLAQALLGALTVAMTMQLAKGWLPFGYVVGAGLLVAIWPHNVTIAVLLLSETLLAFLCSTAMLMLSHALRCKDTSWAAATGLMFGAAALTNAVLLPFGLFVGLFLALRGHINQPMLLAVALGALALPTGWAIRNAQLPDTDSARDRALINLVQGSWPEYHEAWIDSAAARSAMTTSAKDNFATPEYKRVLDAIEREYEGLRASAIAGAATIAQRLAEHPVRYATWYLLQKPLLLWSWSIQVGAGDIYVSPMLNSPYENRIGWRMMAAFCHGLNLLLVPFALVGIFVTRKAPSTIAAQINPGILDAIATLVIYVTVVYSVLQAEPRYSIAFRPYELLLATTGLFWIANSAIRFAPSSLFLGLYKPR